MKCAICGEELADVASGCPLCDAQTVRPEAGESGSGEHLFSNGVLAGRYRLTGLLGRGGMGEVYRAEDLRLEQPVALKLLPPRTEHDADLRRRFLDEVRFARQVTHPNVCRVYDVGEAGGRLFLSMELVDGEDLATLLKRCGRLPRERALDLVAQICTGLSAIHAEGLLHRDLKPANVLIDSEGRARLSDFGLATSADPGAGGDPGGTPAFMAPELLRGGPATVRSDLYSLGLVLYELASGRSPYSKGAVAEIGRVYYGGGAGEIPTPEIDASDLDGVLERVVRWCLAEEPGERPASAEAVAAMLEGSARAEREAEQRARRRAREVRRQRRIWAAALFALAIFGLVVSVLAWRVAREADRAEREAETRRRVAEFLVGIFEVTDPYGTPGEPRGETVTAREILDRGAQRLETDLDGQPEIQARLLNAVGRIYRQLALLEPAADLLEKSLAVRRKSLGDDHPDVATSLHDLADLLQSKGDYAGAEARLREALAIRRKSLGERPEVAATLNSLAEVLREQGKYEDAEALAREALDLKRRLFGAEHRDVAASLGNLAFILYLKGDYAGAEGASREALAMARRLLGEDHPDVAEYLLGLARVLSWEEKYHAAEELYREALVIRRKQLGDEHPGVAQCRHDLAWSLYLQDENEEAEEQFRLSLDLYRRNFGEEHPSVAMNLNNLSLVVAARGDPAAAEAMARDSLAMRRRLLGERHPSVAHSLTNLAVFLLAQDRASEADARIGEALDIFRAQLPAGHWRIAYAESLLGAAAAKLGNPGEGERLLLRAFPVVRDGTGRRSPHTRAVLERLVTLYDDWGKPEKAAEYRALLAAARAG